MFGKVKKWLGIEGVKLELVLPEEVTVREPIINGKIRFSSMNDQTVTWIRVVLVERFTRGRRKEKTTDEYQLGEIKLEKTIEVPANESVEIEFKLPFELLQSEMDEIQSKNLVFGGIVKTAKWIRGVRSEFNVMAEAKVKGVALDPFDKKSILIK